MGFFTHSTSLLKSKCTHHVLYFKHNHFDHLCTSFSQLESEWHRTAPRTKQLVADVSVLRKLLDYLVRYDAFSFYYLLMKLQVASSEQLSPSLWSVLCSNGCYLYLSCG